MVIYGHLYRDGKKYLSERYQYGRIHNTTSKLDLNRFFCIDCNFCIENLKLSQNYKLRHVKTQKPPMP